MRSLIRNTIIVIVALIISIWSIVPPDKKLRLGRDLSGGVSLVYQVQLKPGDPPDVVSRVIEVLKKRIDPNGLSEIQIVKTGQDRIEITMPLPNSKVKKLKADLDAEIEKLKGTVLDESAFNVKMRLTPEERAAEINRIAAGDATRADNLRLAASTYDASNTAKETYQRLKADLGTAKATGAPQARIDELQKQLDDAVAAAADADLAFDSAKKKVVGAAMTAAEVRRALSLSNDPTAVTDAQTGLRKVLPSAQERALDALRKKYPAQEAQLKNILAAYEKFAQERTRLDDPADLKRILSGAGVLDFRITVDPSGSMGSHPQEMRLRQELHDRGPRNVQAPDARWYKINKLDGWFDSTKQLTDLEANPSAYFANTYHLVAEAYEGEYYVLCWDTQGSRLTKSEGDWAVAGAYPSTDPQSGLPAISFEMNTRGAALLKDLTGSHVGKQMAVLLDDEVYTAPNLRSKISRSGQITGSFSDREINYIVNVLAAGSLQAKLSPQPISESTLGPELGADNLKTSFYTGIIAFAMVAGFMIIYYYGSGVIAVIALAYNFVLVLGVMALCDAAFTLPGIAGVVLTFGQAVDANVLIYERMREEFHRGADMRTAVRQGFARGLPPIVDGNISNLIICAMLYFFGTQEIKGFAITLGVGVLTTLFTALVVSRLIFTSLVEYAGWNRAGQLPMSFPLVQKLLSPHVDWMKHRWGFLGALIVFLVASAAITIHEGTKLLGTEFVGGTEVKLQFKTDPATKQPVVLNRHDVQDRLAQLAKQGGVVEVLREAEVLPVNPASDGVTSDKFKIVFTKSQDSKAVLSAITNSFADVMEGRGALTFDGVNAADYKTAPVRQILSRTLGDNLGRSTLRDDVGAFLGGGVILLEHIQPSTTKDSLVSRLDEMRQKAEFADTLSRAHEVRVIEGTDSDVKSAVILVRDPDISPFTDAERWDRDVGAVEWRLTLDALTRASQLASVEDFSAAIARTFTAQAIISVVLSMLMLTIYVWVRFGAGRWAVAATLPLFADVIGIVGMIALARWIYESPATNGIARALYLLPFKLDLVQIPAILTIVGYSLNDKIIILDRIRENKGKTPYASYQVVNDSINQTLSRTFITAGAHMITTIVLYLWGGEAVRGFAFTFNLGVLLGTYTSIVSTPLVWSHAEDLSLRPPPGPSLNGSTPNPPTDSGSPSRLTPGQPASR